MTKDFQLSDTAAAKFEEVRAVYRAVLGRHPDNSETMEMLCNRFLEQMNRFLDQVR